MTAGAERFGIGTRFVYEGQIIDVVQLRSTPKGPEVIASNGLEVMHVALKELLQSSRARLIPTEDGPSADDEQETAAMMLAQLSKAELKTVRERAAHVREVLTGFRRGSEHIKEPDEPRPGFDPCGALADRYKAKAEQLNTSVRTVQRWVSNYRRFGEAGLVDHRKPRQLGVDQRWVDEALAVMVERTNESRCTRKLVMWEATKRIEQRYGTGSVQIPSKTTAYKVLKILETRYPAFRLSAARNRDIAGRPQEPYGKLKPTRPGEFMLMDTTPLDVFAYDPATSRSIRVELTVAMDWYTRCITALRLTPVSTKAVDVAAVLYQLYRPLPAGPNWPDHACWPEHGVPRSVLIDPDAIDYTGAKYPQKHEQQAGPPTRSGGPAIVPETIVIDHGKIYVPEHINSVCARMGISIQPVRLGEGRDKGPVERFFRSVRQGVLEFLPGYAGPDIASRGLDPQAQAELYIDELEELLRQWVAVYYHHRPHSGLVDPHLPSARMSPAQMYEHGLAGAGFIEIPRDPDLAYEFLRPELRTIQPYGVQVDNRIYRGLPQDETHILGELANLPSPYGRHRWPVYSDPDDIRYVYVRHPDNRRWHTLTWELADALNMPMSDERLSYLRRQAAQQHEEFDDRLILDELLSGWNLSMGTSTTEKRIALRMSRPHATLSYQIQQIGPRPSRPETGQLAPDTAPEPLLAQGTSAIAADIQIEGTAARCRAAAQASDDDDDDELDDFYAGALEEA